MNKDRYKKNNNKNNNINKLFISPPFGNYIELPKCTSVKGSFTLEERPGLIMQIFKTLRYSFEKGGWVNKIGLRNKGIDWAIDKYKNTDNIISVAILNNKEIDQFLEKIPDDMNIELNISCPNTKEDLINNNLEKFLNNKREWCSIKLSPHTKMELIDEYYKQGFRQFHCSNTLPVDNGGLSGPSLIPYTEKLTKNIKEKYPDTTVVSGGGIRNIETLNKYKNIGADHFSISTLLFNPFLFSTFYYDYYNTNE